MDKKLVTKLIGKWGLAYPFGKLASFLINSRLVTHLKRPAQKNEHSHLSTDYLQEEWSIPLTNQQKTTKHF